MRSKKITAVVLGIGLMMTQMPGMALGTEYEGDVSEYGPVSEESDADIVMEEELNPEQVMAEDDTEIAEADIDGGRVKVGNPVRDVNGNVTWDCVYFGNYLHYPFDSTAGMLSMKSPIK